jgi:hypothetical protein
MNSEDQLRNSDLTTRILARFTVIKPTGFSIGGHRNPGRPQDFPGFQEQIISGVVFGK